MLKQPAIIIPENCSQVLLHACCAPCSSAIVEWMLQHGVRPTIFYYNPNIYPLEEYEIRKEESKRHAATLGIQWIDGDYRHAAWREAVCGLEGEPERGRRCEQCFTLRLIETAKKARELGFRYFATTLASSRWKSLEQIERAGRRAEHVANGDAAEGSADADSHDIVPGDRVCFWAQNWRKGGLQERRNQLLREYGFYNQQYCGCEFSAGRQTEHDLTKATLRQQMREAKRQHATQLSSLSDDIVRSLYPRLQQSRVVLAYWPLPDEVDLRPLIARMVDEGRVVLLPKVVDDTTMSLHRYTAEADLREGAFHILEPVGEVFADVEAIDAALIPGMAFDAAGHRLGRGRGYYDRFLSQHPSLRKIGVCFPFQRVALVPSDVHDVVMDELV